MYKESTNRNHKLNLRNSTRDAVIEVSGAVLTTRSPRPHFVFNTTKRTLVQIQVVVHTYVCICIYRTFHFICVFYMIIKPENLFPYLLIKILRFAMECYSVYCYIPLCFRFCMWTVLIYCTLYRNKISLSTSVWLNFTKYRLFL